MNSYMAPISFETKMWCCQPVVDLSSKVPPDARPSGLTPWQGNGLTSKRHAQELVAALKCQRVIITVEDDSNPLTDLRENRQGKQ